MVEPVQSKAAQELIIQGVTSDGRQFRPSDWAERLCGAIAYVGASERRQPHLSYSLYVRPAQVHGIKSVMVSAELREIDPLAYHFVLSFAQDNDLQIADTLPST